MPNPITFGELDFNIVSAMDEARTTPKREKPFRILVLGDFSGRANEAKGQPGITTGALKPVRVDRDNFDQVLERLGVKIELSLFGKDAPPVILTFSELDDFHPDSLYRDLDIFQSLKDKRRSLDDPAACTAYAKELQAQAPSKKESVLTKDTVSKNNGSLLDQIIEQGQVEKRQPSSTGQRTELDSFLNSVVRPHLVAKDHPRQNEMIDAIDTAATELMNMILHHNEFQAMEAAWRGLFFLTTRLETDGRLELFLFDMSKKELARDLLVGGDPGRSALYKLLVEKAIGTIGGQAWAVVGGNYVFEKTHEDIEILDRLAKIAKVADCSFIAAAGDGFVTKDSLEKTPDPDDWNPTSIDGLLEKWQALRHLPEAAHVGLALPRFLLRLPYGADTDPIDVFDFEEMAPVSVHKKYLWGNPCFAILVLLGQSFSRDGWQMQPGRLLEIPSLPLHIYKVDGESQLKPCAEVMLSQRAAEQLFGHGLMPLLSLYNQDTIRLGRFQAIAEPLCRLAGAWS